MKKILCVGSITTDILVRPVDDIPPAGTLRGVESTHMLIGGCASNCAIDLAKLGVPSALSCRVGDDSFGRFVHDTCRDTGVDVRGIVTNPASTTTTSVVCIASTGERSFLYTPGSTSDFSLDDVNWDVVNDCDIVFVAGAFLLTSFDGAPCAELMKKARAMGKFTVMDTAWDFEDKWLPKIEAVLPHLDLFMPSYDEAAKITGETDPQKIADKLFDLGVKTVIIKLGKDGALICEDRNTRYILPTYTAYKPVDATGAGDSFCAGFLAGMAQDWGYRRSAEFGNAVGTHCILAVGATTGIPPMAEVLKFMENNVAG